MALLPALVAVVALAWQGVLSGQAVWLSGAAVRAAARAQALGGDPVAAARSSLPPGLSRLVAVRLLAGGAVELALGVPAVVGGGRLATVHARARFAPQGVRR